MDGLLVLLLGVVVIALVVIIADVVMRRIGVDPTIRWLADIIVLIVAVVLVWPRLGI